jgi:hypothetical protein
MILIQMIRPLTMWVIVPSQRSNKRAANGLSQTAWNFGLLTRSYEGQSETDEKKTQWEKLDQEIARLNRESDEGTQYKILFSK